MKDTRNKVIIETSEKRKQLFFDHLEKYCSNSTEWFNTKSEIVVKQYISEIQNLKLRSPSSLRELSDKNQVFNLLNSIDWDFSGNETSYLTHNIHPYPAKYIPQIPCNVISALSLPGELVWDPFGGSGTTALEALLLKRRCISSDANPLAYIIGKAKTTTLDEKEQRELGIFRHWLFDIIDNEPNLLDRNYAIPEIFNIQKWFHVNAIKELAFLKNSIENLSCKSKIIALVAFSRTIAKMSNQESETRYASKPRDIKQWDTVRCFVGDLDTVLTKSFACGSLLQGRTAQFITLDLREPLCIDGPIMDNQIDLIVTSPPYANVTDYHLYHRFRMFWLGFNPVDFGKIEIGSHLRHQREKTGFADYIAEMVPCLRNCYRALKPGRYAVFVLGDAVFKKVVYNTSEAFRNEAKKIGFEHVGTLIRNLPSNRRSFENPARRATQESILILRKPPKNLTLTLNEAPYKLWDYEQCLLKRELSSITNSSPKQRDKKKWSIEIDCYDLDKLNNLTFIHKINSPDLSEQTTWQCFVENREIIENISQRKESKYVTHGVHEYKGKFYPQLCKSLLNISEVKPSGTILDLFMGSGTTILESYLNGYKAFGCDMNPLAVKIAKAKIEVLEMNPLMVIQTIKPLLSDINNSINPKSDYLFQYLPVEAHEELIGWFPEPVIHKLGYLLERINKVPDNRLNNFLQIVLSNIIRDVSQQDPNDLRIRRRKQLLNDAPVLELFSKHLEKQLQKLEAFYRCRLYAPNDFFKPHIWEGDSRSLESFYLNGLSECSVDAVVTSPPYATALPYIDTNRLSLLVLMGMTSKQRDPIEENLIGSREIKKTAKSDIEEKIVNNDYENIVSPYAINLISRIFSLNNTNDVGFRRKNMASLLFKYFSYITQCMQNIHHLLKPNGSLFIVIGNNFTTSGAEKIQIKTTKMLKETALHYGFYLHEEIPISVTTDNVKHINNSIKNNMILWFKKS